MNGRICWEVECILNLSAYDHKTEIAQFLNDGWELVTDGIIYDHEAEGGYRLQWHATLKRIAKPSRMATTEFERSLLELAEGESEQEEINHAVLQ